MNNTSLNRATATPAPNPMSDLEMEIALLHQPAIDSARKLMIWAGIGYPVQAILIFLPFAKLVGFGIYATSAFAMFFGIALAVLGVHLLLSWWAKRQPLPATLTALGVVLAYIGLVVKYDLGGILVPLISLAIIARACMAAHKVHKLRRAAAATPAQPAAA
jgi:hypothetical protein